MNDIPLRYQALCERVRSLAGHRSAPGVLAVSKTRPPEAIRALYSAGCRDIGENYLQEALDKQAALADLPLVWHFIGPIQTNKTRGIAANFDWVHSVYRLKIAQRLNEQRPDHRPPLNVCLQVNIDDESSKSGVTPGELHALAFAVATLPRLRLRGLMCIPRPTAAGEPLRHEPFARLRQLQEGLMAAGLPLDTLSMGMSDDMEAAIAEGSTLVRIGTALFGPRPSHSPTDGNPA